MLVRSAPPLRDYSNLLELAQAGQQVGIPPEEFAAVQVGPSAQEWRQQICPALSCRQIERLVVNFTPCASAPEAVAPEVLRDLGLQVPLPSCQFDCNAHPALTSSH